MPTTKPPAGPGALAALSAQGRAYRIACNRASRAGQLASVASGLGNGMLTRCSVAPELQILQDKHGLPPPDGMAAALLRSNESRQSAAVDTMYPQLLQTWLPRG
ncbi:MAG: transcription regulator protein [Rhodoferax sp.]|nr:transcription regulator protein [Rhodoferax sp.]